MYIEFFCIPDCCFARFYISGNALLQSSNDSISFTFSITCSKVWTYSWYFSKADILEWTFWLVLSRTIVTELENLLHIYALWDFCDADSFKLSDSIFVMLSICCNHDVFLTTCLPILLVVVDNWMQGNLLMVPMKRLEVHPVLYMCNSEQSPELAKVLLPEVSASVLWTVCNSNYNGKCGEAEISVLRGNT